MIAPLPASNAIYGYINDFAHLVEAKANRSAAFYGSESRDSGHVSGAATCTTPPVRCWNRRDS